jgi:DeoR family glycerol-3-phosphate regulon repressor
MKFERTAPVRFGHLRDVDVFVTDRIPAPGMSETLPRQKRSGH